MIRPLFLSLFLLSSTTVFAQTETLDNTTILNLTRAGLSVDLILKKISTSRPSFVVTADALVELKKAGVDDSIIALMMDRMSNANPAPLVNSFVPVSTSPGYSDSRPPDETSAQARLSAKTIAFGKTSLHPSRQALEKELLKRPDFRNLNLTILAYKEKADLYVDVGFVTGSLITHRYVYQIFDRRTGVVIAAGETTSWGSLAENLARHIAKRLTMAVREGRLS
jgi:hypothetical protein